MKEIKILSRYDSAKIILSGKYKSIKDCLENNREADLRRANLWEADLRWADLRWADLWGANLWGADLRGAVGLNKYLTTPLYILADQPGKIRAYKLINEKNEGIYNGGLTYEINKTVEVKNANTNENVLCAEGISLATLDWCIKEWSEGYKILLVEFEAKDIAAIPVASDGKFRVFRCKVIAEKDLKELGLKKSEVMKK